MDQYDVIVIGAGIGGLTAAALLARRGYRTLVLEGHIEAGGCASSYERRRPNGERYIFDVGATLFAGFTPGGAHHWVAQQLGLRWPVRRLEPAMDVWLPDRRVRRWGDGRWIDERRLAFPSCAWAAERFWREQEHHAEIAWRFAARQPPLPPETPHDLLELMRCARPELLALAPHIFSTVMQRLRAHQIHDRRLHTFIDAQLLISAQTTAQRCAWLYGAVALDFARIGVHYSDGGAWSLARTLADSLRRDGGELRYRQRVSRILTSERRAIGIETAHGERYHARHIIANTTIWDAERMLGEAAPPQLRRRAATATPGWGAFTLYLGVDEAAFRPGMAEHQQIVERYDMALGEANSIFISAHPADDATRAPAGQRAITISTHTSAERWWRWRRQDPARYRAEKAMLAEKMIDVSTRAIPQLRQHIRYQQAGTPASFWRYTSRHLGMVGGIPQLPQNSGLFSLGPRASGIARLWLVGDSTFPGQSTAAVTQGAIRVCQAICGANSTARWKEE